MSSQTQLSKAELKTKIITWAESLSLSIGFARPIISADEQQHLRQWLTHGFHGDMNYMQENLTLRSSPHLLMPEITPEKMTIISAKINYWPKNNLSEEQLLNPNQAYISRYALGRDYHKVLRQRLKQLCLMIEQEIGKFLWRPFTDSAPIMEHALAHSAGLGFIGKHSLMIHPKEGSTFFLGEILCDLDLCDSDSSEDKTTPIRYGCGPCNACITHCPTQAIAAPFTVDARRCISYLTIEYQGRIPLELRPLIGNRIYGCDDCQLYCPWNKYAQHTNIADFLPRHNLDKASLLALWQWSESDFLQKTEGSPIRRIGFQQWRRNIAVALGNSPKHKDTLIALYNALSSANDLVGEHIAWAIEQQNTLTATFPPKTTNTKVMNKRHYV